MVVLIAALEWYFSLDVSLGIAYVIPIGFAATVLPRLQIVLLAVICALVRGWFTSQNAPVEQLLRFLMATIAYGGTGLLVSEVSRNRAIMVAHYTRLKVEQELRRKAEEQLRTLYESSPAGILTLDHRGNVIAANPAAVELFCDGDAGAIVGQPSEAFVPAFANALKLRTGPRQMRVSAWTWAKRSDGATFPIATCFSTYGQDADRHLAAIVIDVSEEMRDRERENFRHSLDYHRLLTAAVSHEIRNMCSAASVVASNLSRRVDLAESADFHALLQLIQGLGRMASVSLRNRTDHQVPTTSLSSVLDQLRIVVEPDWREADGTVIWDIEENLPDINADPHGLLQILLNLVQNSLRAVQDSATRELKIMARAAGNGVRISVIDSGFGIAAPEHLFEAFHPKSDGSGLGLFISRALARSYDGDLVHVPTDIGCQFDVTLTLAHRIPDAEDFHPEPKTQTDPALRR